MTHQDQNQGKKESSNDDFPPRKVVCVGAVVLREEKVLFVHQAPGQSLAGQWRIPWGFIEADEKPEDAALRETLEEGGVTAQIEGFLGYQNLNPPGTFGMIFLCRHLSGEPEGDGVETDAARYLGLADFDGLADPASEWCEWLARRVLAGEFSLIGNLPLVPDIKRSAYL